MQFLSRLVLVLFLLTGCLIRSVAQTKPESDPPTPRLACHHCIAYQRWLDDDVRYIATSEEQRAFRVLATNEDRDRFIEELWKRRDLTPDTPENEFKEEHYRRIAYANEHFAANVRGDKTDRGRTYWRLRLRVRGAAVVGQPAPPVSTSVTRLWATRS